MGTKGADAGLERWIGAAIGAISAIGLALTIVPLRGDLSEGTVALLFVLPVLLGAVTGGRIGGAVTAVVATLSFDFFLTRPYLSLQVESADDIETALLLLVVGLLVGTVAVGGRRASLAARQGRSELEAVHRLAEVIANGASREAIIDAARFALTAVLHLDACDFDERTTGSPLPRLEHTGTFNVSRFRHVHGGFVLPSGLELQVLSRGKRSGRFVLHGGADQPVSVAARIAAVVIADHVGAALAEGYGTG